MEKIIGFDARSWGDPVNGIYTSVLPHLVAESDLNFTVFGSLPDISDLQAKKVSMQIVAGSLKEQFALPSYLKQHNIDLWHAQAQSVPLSYSGRFVVCISDLTSLLGFNGIKARLRARLMLESCKRAEKIIVPTDWIHWQLNQIAKMPKDKVEVIAPGWGRSFAGYDFSRPIEDKSCCAVPGASSASVAPEAKTVLPSNASPMEKNLIVAAVHAGSNYDPSDLIKAFGQIHTQLKNAQLVLYGQGVKNLSVKHERITMLPSVSKTRLAQLAQQTRFFVDVSRGAAFDFSLPEWMGLHVPVLYPMHDFYGQMMQSVRPNYKPKDIADLASGMQHLWDQAHDRQNLDAVAGNVFKDFSWPKCAARMADIYRKALA